MSTLPELAASVAASRRRKAGATEAVFGPGASWEDAAALVWRRPGHVEGPASRLAGPLSRCWRLFDARPRALAERAERSGRTPAAEKRLLARTGLLLAAGDVERPQRIRLGRRWIVEPDGTLAVLPPVRLRVAPLLRWYRAAAISAAEADLLDEPWPIPDSRPSDLVPLEDALLWPYVARSPVEDAVFQEIARIEARADLEARVERAELSAPLAALLRAYLVAEDWGAAGDALGLADATTRQRKRRLYAALRIDVTDPGGSDI